MGLGINQNTGQKISGLAELQQRISRLLSTRKGTLIINRQYGSDLPELIDRKINQFYEVDLYAETAKALADPDNGLSNEFKLHRSYMNVENNSVSLSLEGEILLNGEHITLNNIVVN